jgi:uncharacterized membrane protein
VLSFELRFVTGRLHCYPIIVTQSIVQVVFCQQFQIDKVTMVRHRSNEMAALWQTKPI